MHPRFLAEQLFVPFVLTTQSQTPSIHLEEGSAALHCRSVTQGNPKLTEPRPSSTLCLITTGGAVVVVEGAVKEIRLSTFIIIRNVVPDKLMVRGEMKLKRWFYKKKFKRGLFIMYMKNKSWK